MTEAHTLTHDTGALSGLAEQLRARGDPAAELCRLRIARLAYFNAQSRGCAAGPELIDWLQAEVEIARSLPDSITFGTRGQD
jgi:hypothetical protein